MYSTTPSHLLVSFMFCCFLSPVAYLGFHKGGLQPTIPSFPPPLPHPYPPPIPARPRSQDCQNEEADRSSVPSLPFSCPPLPSPPLEVGPLNPARGSRVEMCMGLGFPMGPGIPWESHRNGNRTHSLIGNGNGREWETTSVGMGITCTPMEIYSQRF